MDSENNLQLQIAFATSSQTHLDQHFGSCQSLTIYSITPTGCKRLNSVEFPASQEGHNQQKIKARLDALAGCFAVYCLACGNPVRQQLLAQGTRVIIQPAGNLISELVEQIQNNWPGKVALRQQRQSNRKQDVDYFTQLAESEWEDSEWS
ncbi:NifB/NifX family molybdenum-iron cluster-binding protein [Psychromonas sp.]|uniref:NifB/NifX family molybdenum-iron cluster-binding protein n=1 Tax=Psychromonas sp. TaxID=1884585 RepID=UPI00356868A4